MYYVYIHKFPNRKVYIGITRQKVKDRWKNGKGYKENDYLVNAIKKYGWDNIEHIVLFENLTKEEAEQKEIELIAKYKSTKREFGYNIENGGNSVGKISKETKMKISKTLKGRHCSPKTEFKKGRVQVLSEETKRKISESNKGKPATSGSFKKGYISRFRGIPRSEEVKMKIAQKHCRKVIQYDKNNNYIKIWNSIKEAESYYKIHNIIGCCRGLYKTSGGYVWKYENEVMPND